MSAPKITRRTAKVYLYQGEDRARLDELAAEAEQAVRQSGPRRHGDDMPGLQPAQAYDEFRAEAQERAVLVEMRAMHRRRFDDLRDEHPPREDDEDDERLGVNTRTLADPLIRECITAPEWPSNAARDEFLDELSAPDFNSLWVAAWNLNTTQGSDPKASLVSVVTATFGVTSSARKPGESVAAGS